MVKSILSILVISILTWFGFMGQSKKVTMNDTDFPAYEKQWKNVTAQEAEGKPKTALELVNKIYKQAKQDKNSPQIYKALMYQSRYTMALEENSELTIVNRFKREIETANAPEKQLLQSALAELYWQYYQNNRYKFSNRTATDGGIDESDFRTWDLNRLFTETSKMYTQSLQDATVSQASPLTDYNEILTSYNEDKTLKQFEALRPTLYDLLAHRAIDFYKNDQSGLTKPADQFYIQDEKAFGAIKEFIAYKPSTTDRSSNELKTIKIYQDVLAYHKANKNEDALLQANIERLNFVYAKAINSNKDELYETALKNILKKYNTETAAMAGFQLAKLYQTQGGNYDAFNKEDANQWKLKESLELCNEMIEQYPNSLGAKNCSGLKQELEGSSLNVQTVNDVATNAPFRTKIEYKNIDKVYFKLVKVSKAEINRLYDLYGDDRNTYLRNMKPMATWESVTPNIGDYQNHSYEAMGNNAKGLANGNYVIVASADKDFNEGIKAIGYSFIQATDIAFYKKDTQNGLEIHVKDRTTGKAIPNAEVTLRTPKRRNWGKRQYNKTVKANAEGVAMFTVKKENSGYYYFETLITANGQKAEFSDVNYSNYENHRADWNDQAMIFTDRSIYRPGQPVYFKAISIHTNGEESNLNINKSLKVVLNDANYQEVETLTLKTNEYGSVKGSFVLPKGRLLGNYRIEIQGQGSQNFSVEEYKRPKFEVKLDTLEGNYKLGSEITAEGVAKAYSGATVSNAKVAYRVVREVRYPYWRYYWWRPIPSSPSAEIANGEVETDEKGRFKIPFTALADQKVNLNDNPVFSYKIYADVTDINGETRSGESIVKVGAVAMDVSISASARMLDSDKNSITITTKNLNGAPLSAKAEVSVYKLTAPSTVLVSRLWNAPNQFGLEKEEFKKYFPNEPFNEQESKPDTWVNGKQVVKKTITTDANGTQDISITTKKWNAGFYRIEVNAKDKFGKEITKTQLVEIIDVKAKKVSDNQLFTFSTDKDVYEPGDVAKVTFGSATDVEVLVEVLREEDEVLHTEIVKLNNNIKTISIPIKENYRGGIGVFYSLIKNNRYFTGQEYINVPFTNKELKIDVKTFRDKLQPNQEETWTFTVKGDKADKVNAEFLASMYDASLDQFKSHNWYENIPRRSFYGSNPFGSDAFSLTDYLNFNWENRYYGGSYKKAQFRTLDFFDMNLGYGYYGYGLMYESSSLEEVVVTGYGGGRRNKKMARSAAKMEMKEVASADKAMAPPPPPPPSPQPKAKADSLETNNEENKKDAKPSPRKNLQETAFFLPQLSTDKDGNVSFSFTTPEALTTWKFMAFAHTKELQTGMYTGETVTQKELMVTPNAPRFFREGDEVTFSSKLSNITKKVLTGQAELVLLDATTMQPIAEQLGVRNTTQNFSVDAEGNTVVTWKLTIPQGVPAVTYQVLAKAGNFTDGEENALPVLSNRKLVTESLPIALRSNQTRTFTLDKLANNGSQTLVNHKLTLEMTSNPAWYAVQSLPYLMEYPYECTEQMFSRYYANSIATHVANSNPKIESVFKVWREQQPDALKSNLEKNEELKSLILRETPWVREAQSEAELKRRIGLLFDLNKMASEQASALQTIQQRQQGNGGWSWFPGGRTNRYISQHIVAGFGHLDRLQVKNVQQDAETQQMVRKAIQYLDSELTKDFRDLKRYNKDWKKKETISPIHVHYFYTRSFFKDQPVKASNKEAYEFYYNLLKKNWLSDDLYRSGQMALAFHRFGEQELAQKIMTSLEERSITNDELGMYWKSNTAGYYWYQAPIETQALMIEAFDEVANNQSAVDELKVWLLKNKQTNSWETTKATTEAVYALLLRGGDWLAIDEMVSLTIGNEPLNIAQLDGVQAEAGTGYVKTSWNKTEITPEMATVTATKKGDGIAWGALYWQYFEDLDKITTHETPLKLEKQLFVQTNTSTGPKISPIANNQTLNIGDLVKVRITLRSDRDMEFVHMKDMRAAGFEPTNVLSQYKWQDGLGYYQSTKDASTDFFFDYLPKGEYVFEYELRVNNAGDFSNGITTIQCMYAPEFTSHSEGIRVKVTE